MKSESLHHSMIARASLFLSSAILMNLLLFQTSLAADRYVSTTGADTDDCLSTPCLTVAYAVTQAASGDTINIGPGIFYENLDIYQKSLSFIGAGMDVTILDGNSANHVISNFTNSLTVQDMTIRNGRADTESGGGISHFAIGGYSLTLTRVKVTGNSAQNGGGISTNAPFTMTDCVVSRNEAKYGADTIGGGILIAGDSGVGNLTNVTISDNTSTGSGGGIHNQLKGTVNLSNVTITGNYASRGGALLNTNDCVMNLTNSTIALNSYYTGGFGAGIVNYATTNFRNTIMSGNGGANCFNGSSYVTKTYGGNLDSGNTCGFTHPSDYRNTDPLLGTLGDNGGYVETMALITGSLAIDSGANSGYPASDARGVARPEDGNGNGVAVCDIGAFERCGHKPAAILGALISDYYDSVGEAYAVITGTTVISLQTYQFNEDLDLTSDYSVTLNGGYGCDYSSNTGKFSALKGSLTVSHGTATLANLIVK